MAAKKIIVVFGATGIQGGSVVKSLLGDSATRAQFTVRAVTRDASKESAVALAKSGAEVVTADLEDKASLTAAIKGAYGVFSVTNHWEKKNGEVETQQGKNVADVSKELGVQHLVWSSLLNITKLSGGTLTAVTHFDAKAAVEEYIVSLGIPATFFLAGFYASNLPGKSIRPNPSTGAYTLALPIPTTSPIPLFDAAVDTGNFVKGIFLNREKTLGKRVLGATDYYTPTQIMDTFKEVKPEAGKGAAAIEIPGEMFKGFMAATGAPAFLQEEMLQNFQLIPRFGYFGGESLDFSHSLVSEPPTTWKQFVTNNPVWADLK